MEESAVTFAHVCHSDSMRSQELQKKKRGGETHVSAQRGDKGMRHTKLVDMLLSCKRVPWTSKVLLPLSRWHT